MRRSESKGKPPNNTVTQSGAFVNVAFVAGGGRHATSLILQWQVVGVDADFGHDTPVILAGQTVGPFPAGATVNVRPLATNSVVTTAVTIAVKTITLT